MLASLERRALKAARGLSKLGLAVMLAFAAMTLLDGLMRALGGRPIDAVRDLGGPTVAIAVAMCFPQAFLERSHITITVIEAFVGARVSHAVSVLASMVTCAIAILFAWQFHAYAGKLVRAGERTAMLQVPTAPFWYTVAALLTLAAGAQLLVVFSELRGRVRSTADPAL